MKKSKFLVLLTILAALAIGVGTVAATTINSDVQTDSKPDGDFPNLTVVGEGESFDIDGTKLVAEDTSAFSEALRSESDLPETYLVQLIDPPAASYRGGIPGLLASYRGPATKFDSRSPQARAYVAYLETEQAVAIREAEKTLGRYLNVEFTYQYAVNGFAATLNPDEVARLERMPNVERVWAMPDHKLETDVGPGWIGATEIWDGSALPEGVDGTMGEGIVIGILDSGLNLHYTYTDTNGTLVTEAHPSFADIGGDGYDHTNPLGTGVYLGVCDPADANYDATLQCNDKVIGAYNFHPDGNSPDDVNGHGTHVASTAGGNVISSTLNAGTASAITKTISGVAPHANLIIYAVEDVDGGCCNGEALFAAYDQLVADANIVDVMNYSIGGGDYSPWTEDASPLAFLSMFDAGIVVVTSAGNSGPGVSSLGSPGNAPWMLTVGNLTHNRFYTSHSVDFGQLQGISAVEGTSPIAITDDVTGPLVYSGNVDEANVEGCSAFAAEAFAGSVAMISRGSCSFADKFDNAAAAGATAVIIHNNNPGLPIVMGGLENATLPGVMISLADGEAIAAALDPANPGTVQISASPSYLLDPELGDIMSSSSSRGPQNWGDWIEPDVAAPGSNIWAAYADDEDTTSGPDYSLLSGTSMASPHVAGSAALLRALHPDWTVAEIYSALMSTGTKDVLKEDGVTPADPFDFGGGRVQVDKAANAGLLLNETTSNFANSDPANGGDPTALNLATFGDGSCILTACDFSRSLTNATGVTMTWEISHTSPITISLSPSTTFTLGPDESVTLEASLDPTGMPVDEWVFGDIILTPVQSPTGTVSEQTLTMALRPIEPFPAIDVSPTVMINEMLTNTVMTDTTAIVITNEGFEDLEWEFGAGEYEDYQLDNPISGSSGLGSFIDYPSFVAAFSAADFELTLPTTVTEFLMPGFSNAANLSEDAIAVYFEVYTNSNGIPAGDPFNGGGIWNHVAYPGDPGLNLDSNNIELNLREAGLDALALEPGTYWVTAAPYLVTGETYFDGWFWNQGDQVGNPGMFTDFGFFGGIPWTSVPDLGISWPDFALRVSGITSEGQCPTPADYSWLSTDIVSGTLGADQFDAVSVVYDTTGLGAGTQEALLCVTSNDTEMPVVPVEFTLEVVDTPDVLACNAEPIRFIDGMPAGWEVVDNEQTGVAWYTAYDFAGFLMGGVVPYSNWTNGIGNAATASSDFFAFTEFDTELRTTAVDMGGYDRALLTFSLNYQNLAGLDFLDLDMSIDGGTTWETLLSLNEDYGTLGGKPGVDFEIEMNGYGDDEVMFRWHYYDPNTGDWDWYAQVDDIALECGSFPEIFVLPYTVEVEAEAGYNLAGNMGIWNDSPITDGLDLEWNIFEGQEFSLGRAADQVTENVADGGFEEGSPNPYWGEFDSQGFSPICSAGSCGADIALDGDYYAWFGGWGTAVTQSLTQTVTLTGTANEIGILSYNLLIANSLSSGPQPMTLTVTLGDDIIATYTEAMDDVFGFGYVQETVDVTAYLDGGSYELGFYLTSANAADGAGNTNMFMDNVSLKVFDPATLVPCANPSAISWLGAAPTSGVTGPGGALSLVQMQLSTVGLEPGQYTASYCIESNDPVIPLWEVPVTMTVVAPSLEHVTTVSTDGTCNTDTAVGVEGTEDVTFCFEITNTGDATLWYHEIWDHDDNLLMEFEYPLVPGATETVTMTAAVDASMTMTSTWYAYNSPLVDAVDTAPAVDVYQSALDVQATVGKGTDCGVTPTIGIGLNTDVTACVFVTNTGSEDLISHTLTIDGVPGSPVYQTLAPGETVTTTLALSTATNPPLVYAPITIQYGWLATGSDNALVQASGSTSVTIERDEDSDGIGSNTEAGAPNNGDGNGDGIPDNKQANVASTTNQNGDYITISTPQGKDEDDIDPIEDVAAFNIPSNKMPPGVSAPQGAIQFKAVGRRPVVTLYFHTADNIVIDSYLKQDANGNWFNFTYDGNTGAVITKEADGKWKIVLHLEDGGRGDRDGVADGKVTDPGIPATNSYRQYIPLIIAP